MPRYDADGYLPWGILSLPPHFSPGETSSKNSYRRRGRWCRGPDEAACPGVYTMAIAGKKLSVFEGRMKSVITINVSAGHGGSIKPSAGVAIGYGLSKMFAITPRWGYAIEDVVVDGISVG